MHWIAISTVILIVLAAAVGALLAVMFVREQRAKRRFQILGEIAAVSDAGGSLEDTIDALCGILVPDLADICIIDLLVDGEVRRAAVRVAPREKGDVRAGLERRPPSFPE